MLGKSKQFQEKRGAPEPPYKFPTPPVPSQVMQKREVKKMDAIIVIGGTSEEIAALAVATQGRQDAGGTSIASEREHLIREYERRLARLKSGQPAI